MGHGLRCFAQPRAARSGRAPPFHKSGAKPARHIHLYEFKKKIYMMKFSPIRVRSLFREPWEALARRPSTTLSTAIVDKRKTVNGSLAYRAFLRIVATSHAN